MPTPLGRVLEPQRLFGRERELARMWDLLQSTGSNVLLSAPRRVGKSSFLRRLEWEADGRGYCPVLITVADCETEVQFVERLLAESWKSDGQKPWHKSFLDSAPGKVLSRIKAGSFEFKPDAPGDWEQLSSAVAQMLDASPEPKLFLIDELPLFVAELLRRDPDRSRARRFLGWMKGLRENVRHRWVVAGSVGLDTIARRGRLSGTIADLYVDTRFGPFDRQTAANFVVQEAAEHEFDLSADQLERILSLTHDYHVPYYLVLLVSEFRLARDDRQPFSIDSLLGKRTHFSHWDERLEDIFGAGTRDKVDEVLSAAAISGNGIHRDQALDIVGPEHGREILDVLINDSYLHRREDRVVFRCELIRLYWSRFIAE